MTVFSVLDSFLYASAGNEENELVKIETTDGDSSGFFSPGMDKSVLAPYNFNFV
jgi:hypothetical protein